MTDLHTLAAAGELVQNAQAWKIPEKFDGDLIAELPGSHAMEPKYDGWRLLAFVGEGTVEFFTRTGNYPPGDLPHVRAELLAHFPAGTVLDGEAVALVHTPEGLILNEWKTAQSVLTTIGGHAAAEKITFMVFDLIAHAGLDARALPHAQRRVLLERIFSPVPETEQETLLPEPFKACQLATQMEATTANHETLVKLGFEGSVVKSLTAPYASNKRGHGWMKIKPTQTMEAIVMGFKPGENSFTGLIGAIIFGQYAECEACGGSGEQGAMTNPPDPQTYESGPCGECGGDGMVLVERGRCSGMDMRTRIEITHNQEKWLGKVIEIAHLGWMEDGYRSPQFKRIRPDKKPGEVVVGNA